MTRTAIDIDTRYPLTDAQIRHFRERGFVKLKEVLSPEALDHYGREITNKVIELNTMHLPMEERDTYSRAFLQVMNIWEHSKLVREFVFSQRLGRIATELLGTEGVRMYHDQALYKEAGGGYTPWHVDQVYWPLATEKTVTAWIPLQETPLNMGARCFAANSHHFTEHRNLKISDESEKLIQAAMDGGNYEYVEEPFDLGEVSFHYGWTYHRAGANTSGQPRRVMTIIYMDRDMVVNHTKATESDWEMYANRLPNGAVCAGPLNPVLYEQSEA